MQNVIERARKFNKWELIASTLLIALFVMPFFSFASSNRKIYVNASVSSSGDGSAAHPYKTIKEALSNAKKNSEVHILPGKYKENVEIPNDVEVFGESEKSVVITGATRTKPVVIMNNETKINKVTIEKGEKGIEVKHDSKASIVKVTVRDNKYDGIKIQEADVKDKKRVSITESTITENGRNGIFSEKRKITLIDNEISDNENDGVGLAKGTSAWIEDNQIKYNDGSGMSLALDKSNIWTKNNTFRENKHDGVEVNAYGKSGRIDINKSKFIKNKGNAIARIQRATFPQNIWNGLTVQGNVKFDSNKKGDVSRINMIFGK